MMPEETAMRQAFIRILMVAAWAGALAGCATTPGDIARWEALGGYEAVGRIQPELHSPKPELRQAAIAALLKLSNDQAALNALEIATLSPEPAVRGDVGVALLFNPNPDLDFYSITLIADPDPEVRRQIAQGLAAAGRAGPLLNTQRAGVYLWGLTQDANADVRAAAVEGVGGLGLNDPIDFALDALRRDPEPRVRAAAARGLGTPVREYLAGKTSSLTPVRGEEMLAALCEAARTDKGKFSEVQTQRTLLWTQRVEETRWVAAVAAEALTVPGVKPRADVAAALAAEQRLGTPAPLPAHFHLQSSHHPGPL
jgi:hypothetical protein